MHRPPTQRNVALSFRGEAGETTHEHKGTPPQCELELILSKARGERGRRRELPRDAVDAMTPVQALDVSSRRDPAIPEAASSSRILPWPATTVATYPSR